MHTSTSVGRALSALATIALLADCSGASPQLVAQSAARNTAARSIAHYVAGDANGQFKNSILAPQYQKSFTPRQTKSWMKPEGRARLTYISDYASGNVTVFGRDGSVQGQIGGLTNPQGLFVDRSRNLWVANTGAANVEVYERGAISPEKTLTDPIGPPVDVTICPDGTVYVSNGYEIRSGGTTVSVYANGSKRPTSTLTDSTSVQGLFITCDAAGNVFWEFIDVDTYGIVAVFPGGQQGSERYLNILSPGFPGGVKPTNAGNILIADQLYGTITEYSEAGMPTGNKIRGVAGIADMAVTKDGRLVGGAISGHALGNSWTFPGGTHRQTYRLPSGSRPMGFAFDPGQQGI
jgi:hypothetical protein